MRFNISLSIVFVLLLSVEVRNKNWRSLLTTVLFYVYRSFCHILTS